MAEDNEQKCPTCKRPAHSSRWKGGERHLICGNGHNWPRKTPERSEQARKADRAEGSPDLIIILDDVKWIRKAGK